MPSNCGPLYPSRVAGSSEPPVERTCECLTQSLGCYGCGAQVGYNIVSPCARCTSSVVKHQRSSNGHRTVLHCSEISVRERRYVPGEPGILASPPPLPPSYLSLGALGVRTHSDDALASYSSSRDGSSTSLNSLHYNGLDDPLDAEKAEAAALAAAQAAEAAAVAVAAAHAQAQHAQSRSSSGWKKTPRVLRRGDSVYWSDLVPGGERAEPFDPDLILSMPIAGR